MIPETTRMSSTNTSTSASTSTSSNIEGSVTFITPIEDISIITSINSERDMVRLIISGPSDRYFGVGFGSLIMNNTYGIIGSGINSVSEHKLLMNSIDQSDTVLDNQIKIESDLISNGIRIITLTRPRTVIDKDYFDFPYS